MASKIDFLVSEISFTFTNEINFPDKLGTTVNFEKSEGGKGKALSLKYDA